MTSSSTGPDQAETTVCPQCRYADQCRTGCQNLWHIAVRKPTTVQAVAKALKTATRGALLDSDIAVLAQAAITALTEAGWSPKDAPRCEEGAITVMPGGIGDRHAGCPCVIVKTAPHEWHRCEHGTQWRYTDTEACAAMPDEAGRLRAERDKFRGHSITLNTIGYAIAETLGKVSDGADHYGNPKVDTLELIAEVAKLRAQRDAVLKLCDEAILTTSGDEWGGSYDSWDFDLDDIRAALGVQAPGNPPQLNPDGLAGVGEGNAEGPGAREAGESDLAPDDKCPSCGHTVHRDWINADSALHGPKQIPGRWRCRTPGCKWNPDMAHVTREPPKATGGIVNPGGIHLIGEQGPTWLTMVDGPDTHTIDWDKATITAKIFHAWQPLAWELLHEDSPELAERIPEAHRDRTHQIAIRLPGFDLWHCATCNTSGDMTEETNRAQG